VRYGSVQFDSVVRFSAVQYMYMFVIGVYCIWSDCICIKEWGGAQVTKVHSSVQLVEKPGCVPYLLYTESVSKNNPGGLKHRKVESKQVTHNANRDLSIVLWKCTGSIACTALAMLKVIHFTLLLS